MKKLFTLFLALATSAGTIFAESGTCGSNLTWSLTDGVLTISGTGAMWDYDYQYAPWYSQRKGITSIVIDDDVPSIGNKAFEVCTNLTSVTIGNSVTSIGVSAFSGCTSLTSVTIPNSVTNIGVSAFYGCSGLTSVTIPLSVTSIGSSAFSGCTSLPVIDNIRYADTYLVEIVDKTLSSYTIREGTRWIGNSAFSGCSSLTSITIPNSVTSIGGSAFSGCTSLPVIDNIRYADTYLVEIVDKTLSSYNPLAELK